METQIDLLRRPSPGEIWTPGDGCICEVYAVWADSPENNGVVVRWRHNPAGHRCRYTFAEFNLQFVRVDESPQADLFGAPLAQHVVH